MVDILTPIERSQRMAAIRSKDTLPELALRRALHALGFRYRVNDRRFPGKPDIVLPRYRAVVFVHGCFWHRHPGCKVASTPKSNVLFWAEKFAKNIARDERSAASLIAAGWRVFVAWECDLSSGRKVADMANRLRVQILIHTPALSDQQQQQSIESQAQNHDNGQPSSDNDWASALRKSLGLGALLSEGRYGERPVSGLAKPNL